MTISGEGLVNALKSHMETNLPARLVTVAAQYTDGLALPNPVGYLIREPDIRSLAQAPALFILIPRTRLGALTSGEVADIQHDVWIYVLDRRNDPTEIKRSLYRYTDAVYQELKAFHSAGGHLFTLTGGITDIDYSPILTRGSVAMGDVRIETTFQSYEEA